MGMKRVNWVGLCLLLGLGCGSSSHQYRPSPPIHGASANAAATTQVLGLWRSNFGPVKIERDDSRGGSHLMGVWRYERNGTEIIGYFQGQLDGNVMHLRWQEPAQPKPLVGKGYLTFDSEGGTFTGRWWTDSRDRQGEWNGWRPPTAP